MNPSPIARKLNCPGRKIPARNEIIVRPIAARKQSVETMRSCRSTRNGTLKSRSLLGNQAFACALARKSLKLASIMNTKRLIIAIVVAFVVLWVTDFLIHGVWMTPDYRATQRSGAQMRKGTRTGLGCLALNSCLRLPLSFFGPAGPGPRALFAPLDTVCSWASFRESGPSLCMSSFRCLAQSPANGSSPVSRNQC